MNTLSLGNLRNLRIFSRNIRQLTFTTWTDVSVRNLVILRNLSVFGLPWVPSRVSVLLFLVTYVIFVLGHKIDWW